LKLTGKLDDFLMNRTDFKLILDGFLLMVDSQNSNFMQILCTFSPVISTKSIKSTKSTKSNQYFII